MTQIKTEFYTLPLLPYRLDALEPWISAKTLEIHYGKHHQTYVDKLNELVLETRYADMTLEEVIAATSASSNREAIFHNAAQVWNHNFYWNSLSPEGGKKPSGDLGRKIEISFGGYENFIKEFAAAGMSQFGSGWVWLIRDGSSLKITKTSNAENPISQMRGAPLLVLDVWEHAYYLDYQNRRSDYLAAILDKLINWNFATENFNRL